MPSTTRPRWAPELPADRWDEELHPDWCDAVAPGCGLHYGHGSAIEASTDTDGHGDCPTVHTAPVMDADGNVGVSVGIEVPGRYGSARLTIAEARAHAAAVLAAVEAATQPTRRRVRHYSYP